MLELLIVNGQVIDGSGAPGFAAGVGVIGDRIVELGITGNSETAKIIDASGCVVTPGFVDMHSHADFSLPICPTANSLVHQGVTTVVTGQCGLSTVPVRPQTRGEFIAQQRTMGGTLPWQEWASFESYLSYLQELGTSVNVVPLVGQGTLRAAVMGMAAEPATDRHLREMKLELEIALGNGAAGLSTGLIYPPGSYTSTEELVLLVGVVAARDRMYFSHIRGEADSLIEAVSEAIEIGRKTGVSVQISHLKAAGPRNWDKAPVVLEMINRALSEGIRVAADIYPYEATSTFLYTTLPHWAQSGGKAFVLERIRGRRLRNEIASEMELRKSFRTEDWSRIRIASSPANKTYEGRSIMEIAKEADRPPSDCVLDILDETSLDATMILFCISEDNITAALRHPAVMIGSDGEGRATAGPLAYGVPHPRSYGAFARVLGRYVRDLGILSLEEAVHKMTGLPAHKLGWKDRGLVKEGSKADLVVFRPDEIADLATFEMPHEYAVGVSHVVVNGQLVISEGDHTGARPGEILRR